MHQAHTTDHIPVLLEPVLAYLQPKLGESYLDLTAGYGGHADAVVARTEKPQAITLIDRDQNALRTLQRFQEAGAELLDTDFLTASRQLRAEGRQFDMILADLGVSSPHLDNASRGFAFSTDGPLDMRMDQRSGLSAADIVNTYAPADIIRILRLYGEESRANAITEAIVAARPIHSTGQLADIIRSRVPKRGKTDPATKTFQGLRIAVNDELEQLRAGLPLWYSLLAPGGRIAIISFHSLEDRIVKQALKEVSGNRYDAELQLLTKHPVTADRTELVSNPRARSAKLRAAVKNKK